MPEETRKHQGEIEKKMKLPDQIGYNYVFVEMNSLFTETTGKGYDGKSIRIDTTYNPRRHARTWAEVKHIPRGLREYTSRNGKIIIDEEHPAAPVPQNYQARFKYINEIYPEIQVGDIIIFDPAATFNPQTRYQEEALGENIYGIRYDMIYCAIRFHPINKNQPKRPTGVYHEFTPYKNPVNPENDLYKDEKGFVYKREIIMIGGWALVKPDMEDWQDILVPVYYPKSITGGQKRLKPKSEWIQSKIEPQEKPLKGFVHHIGKNLKFREVETLDLKVGDYVLYRPKSNNSGRRIKIMGEVFYAMKQKFLWAILEKPAKRSNESQAIENLDQIKQFHNVK